MFGRKVSVTSPSVFANWCLCKLDSSLPILSTQKDKGASFFKLHFKGIASRSLRKISLAWKTGKSLAENLHLKRAKKELTIGNFLK